MSSGSPKTSRFGIQAMFLVLFAVLCGIAGTGMRLWRQEPPVVAAPTVPPAQFKLVLASSDLLPGREIRASDFYTSMVGKDEYLKVLKDQSAFGDGKQLIGRLVRMKVEMNRPFPLDCVFPEGTGPTPADLLSEGMRAVTVKMNLIGGIRGFVAPESWVDVLFRRSDKNAPPDSTASARTHTVFPGVRVLAIQDSLYPQTVLTKDSRGIVAQDFEITLELTPQQCEVLKSIEDRGDLTLNMLPKEADRQNLGNVPSPEIMKLLLGVEEPKPVPVPPFVPSVRVVRGGAQSSVVVDHPYDIVIDQHLYPAPDVPGAAAGSSVPEPEVGSGAGSVWPQSIPPVKSVSPSSSDATGPSPALDPASGVGDGDQQVEPVEPQPSRGTRANQDTIFAHRPGRVVYPANASRNVAIPVHAAQRRPTAASSASGVRAVNRAMSSSSLNQAVQSSPTQRNRQHLRYPESKVVLVSGRQSGSAVSSRLPSMSGSALPGNRVSATAGVGSLRNSASGVRVPTAVSSTIRRKPTTPPSSPASPVVRSYALTPQATIRRSASTSGLVPLRSGSRSTSESVLAYASRSRGSSLPELKIGRR